MAPRNSSKNLILDKAYELVMVNGYAGTSIDMILQATGLTKGAFFYHFKSKTDLGMELARRYVNQDSSKFYRIIQAVDKQMEDPLERNLVFIERLAEWYEGQTNMPGCLFASFSYYKVSDETALFMKKAQRKWRKFYSQRYEEIMQQYPPRIPVRSEDLADHFMGTVEGGFVLSRIYQQPEHVAMQLRQFKNYVQLIFEPEAGQAARG